MLTAIYGAIYSAEKLTRPVQDLIAGTRAVGKGDFGTRLPLPSRDEMGFLVHSFNDMTKRLRRAREETTRSQMAVERERERLSIILARLSTGVISIGRDLVLRSANHAASSILGVDLDAGHRPAARGTGRREFALRALRRRSEHAPRQGRRGMARADGSQARDERRARAGVRLHAAAGRRSRGERSRTPGRLRDRVRRHQRAAAGAARRGLGRSRAPARARDQESAHADPAVRGTHAAPIPRIR